jgi:arsenate reductase
LKLNKLTRQIIAEFIGTAVFLTAIVGATASASPFGGVAAPVALGLMMVLFGDLSGGHFNPVVSLFFFARRQLSGAQFGTYVAAQLAGSVAGVALAATIWNQGANLTFNTGEILATPAVIVSELVGTTVLVWLFAKFAGSGKGNLAATVVAAWVFAAGTFTSTHAIANPAVTFGRFFTAVSGAGIQANVGVELMLAQVGGALLALILLTFVTEKGFAKSKKRKKS